MKTKLYYNHYLIQMLHNYASEENPNKLGSFGLTPLVLFVCLCINIYSIVCNKYV